MHATRTVRLVPKVRPITDQEGPEGEYSHCCTLPLNLALDEDGRSTSRPCHFTRAKTRYPLYRRLSGPTWTLWTGAGNFSPHWASISGPSRQWQVNIPAELSRRFRLVLLHLIELIKSSELDKLC
jgi:hypothetical protein